MTKARTKPLTKTIDRIARKAARVEVFFFALLWLMILLVIGTIAQRSLGIYDAQHTYFSTLFFWLGPLPLPGGYLAMGLIFFNLLAKIVFLSPWIKSNAGTLITHMGALLLLFGGFLTAVYSYEGYLQLAEGQSKAEFSDYHDDTRRTALPFSVELIDFEKKMHPGTNKAKSYSSAVKITDGDVQWQTVISMNEPLRYKGYTFFQSSFIIDGEQEFSVLNVVENIGWLFPYISSTIMCFGLLLHIFLRLPKLMRPL